MTNSRANPVGRRWTEVLRFLDANGAANAAAVAEHLWPSSVSADESVSDRALRSADLLLARMRTKLLVTPSPGGGIWVVGNTGRAVLDGLSVGTHREYKTTRGVRKKAKALRAERRARQCCINENRAGTHGQATHGCRCKPCHDTHRRRK